MLLLGVQAGAGLHARTASFANVDNVVSLPGYATMDLAVYRRAAHAGAECARRIPTHRFYAAFIPARPGFAPF